MKISEIPAQVTMVCNAIDNMRKDRIEMKVGTENWFDQFGFY